jgi:hypothetical protein
MPEVQASRWKASQWRCCVDESKREDEGEMSERHVGFTIADWPGTWADLEDALDQFASDNGVALESVEMYGPGQNRH